jgi:ubiquinone/menaquinone biosynthesis C-methylase UbiE
MPTPGTTNTAAELDYRAITRRQQIAWAAGDVARVGSLGTIHGELLCEALDIHPGERVLDIAAGNGAAAVAAARRWAEVVATDFVDHLLDSARRIADAYALPLETRIADAQELPFEDDTFDVVMSTFGSMFAPNQQAVADEAIRVCRPSGRIGLATWAPGSLVGDACKVTERHVPPPSGLRKAYAWGTEERIRELFGNRINSLRITTRLFTFRFRSPRHMLEHLRAWDGPTQVAFDALATDEQERLAADLLDVYATYNRATDGTLVAPSEYLEIVAVVR